MESPWGYYTFGVSVCLGLVIKIIERLKQRTELEPCRRAAKSLDVQFSILDTEWTNRRATVYMFPQDTRILLAEDTDITRAIMKQMLGKMGFKRVTEVDNGLSAWEEIERALRSQSPFKLAIVDWNMPGMHGLDLLKQIQSYEETRNLPFILLTSNTEKEQVMQAMRSGVSIYIAKPFPAAVLEKKLEEAWELAQKRRVA